MNAKLSCLPTQQDYGDGEADDRDGMTGTEQAMSVIHLPYTLWQRSGGGFSASANIVTPSRRSHGQNQLLSHIHIPAIHTTYKIVTFTTWILTLS